MAKEPRVADLGPLEGPNAQSIPLMQKYNNDNNSDNNHDDGDDAVLLSGCWVP